MVVSGFGEGGQESNINITTENISVHFISAQSGHVGGLSGSDGNGDGYSGGGEWNPYGPPGCTGGHNGYDGSCHGGGQRGHTRTSRSTPSPLGV